MEPGSDSLNPGRVAAFLRRRLPLIALCAVIVASAAYVASKRQTEKYTATASLVFNTNTLAQQIAGLSVGVTNPLVQQASNVELVRLGDMAERTAEKLGGGLTPGAVSGSVSVSAQGESTVVDVSVTDTSPARAARIANTYVKIFVAEQTRATRAYFKSALKLVERQLAELSPSQREGQDGLALQNRAQTLRLLSGLSAGTVQIAQKAVPPTTPSSPKTSRNTALGLLLGLVIGFGLALLLEQLDRRIREAEELERIYDVPLLGVVPASRALAARALEASSAGPLLVAAEAETFNLVRARLRFFNVDRQLRTLLVVSPESQDGKSTVALSIAESAARAGSQRAPRRGRPQAADAGPNAWARPRARPS